MTPDEVEVLFKSTPEDDGQRVKALEPVLSSAQELREAQSLELDLLAEKVGNGSREESWRTPLGASGLLDFFLSLIDTDGLRSSLATHTLRIIGNSCADRDENRRRVIESGCLPKIVALLNVHSLLLPFVIPVLFNICVDYEPAQVAVYKAGLNPELVNLLASPQPEKIGALIGIIHKLLALVAGQEPEANLVHRSTPSVLLTLATNPAFPFAFEDFFGLSSVALTYLSHQQFQDSFLNGTSDAITLFLNSFSKTCSDYDVTALDDEEKSQLIELQSAFTKTLADLSAGSQFASLCALGSPGTQTLQRWLSSPHAPLQSAACLALGNIARSDATCTSLVQEYSIHKPLLAILSSSSGIADAQLLHSALSFLKNLSIPASNKAVLGDAGLLDPDVLPRIWDIDAQPQIQFDAVSLTRLLLVNCPANVHRVCSPLPSTDPLSSAEDRTLLNQLMVLHSKADQEPIKMETARAAANICRVLHSESPVGSSLVSPTSPTSPTGTQSTLQTFYTSHPSLPSTLLYLAQQPKFPVLRSELWFVLALMARSAEGASVITHSLRHPQHPALLDPLVEAVTGEKPSKHQDQNQDIPATTHETNYNPPAEGDAGPDLSALSSLGQLEPQQVDPTRAATMAKVDRENGLVLVAELLKRFPDELSSLTRDTFTRLLKTGGELILGDRNEESR
ncbi:hypothetical protein AAE478_008117 [Parahypoxylon ruwenzoriense]